MKAISFGYLQKYPHFIIPAGFVGGLLGGAIARAWMRWISTEREFTWPGTLGVVMGFAVFGAMQATVYAVRRKHQQKSLLALVRILGVIFSLQLFLAAGATMLPTVLSASLAVWRDKWKFWIRVPLSLIGFIFWIMIVNSEIVYNFGWSIATIARILLFGLIYLGIIYALRPTISERI